MSSFADLAIDGHVATVTLRATGKGPRMSAAFWNEMPSFFGELDKNDAVRAIVLRGDAGHFSFGLDLATMAAEVQPHLSDGALAGERRQLLDVIERLQASITAVASCRKPVIAAITGWCIGGGVDLATACDIRICSSDTQFSIRETRLAMVADVGTLARLPAIIGQGAARLLALTGDDVSADRAKELGLVTDVYPTHEALFAAAGDLAKRIAANSPLAVQGTKAVMNLGSERAARESLQHVALWNAAFLSSHDFREAFAAFAQKREPKFTGR